MATFTPRTTVDGIYQSKYWYSDNPFHSAGYGLPNCTCYAWGRFYEISGVRPDNMPTGDGGDWYPRVVQSGAYKTGQTPKLGAVVCWSSNTGGGGHVAIVERINADGSFLISQSGYYRPIASYPPDTEDYFWTNTCDGTTKMASWMTTYTFQGFIYNPYVTDETVVREWVSKNNYLTQSEMENNAILAWNYFGSLGWSLNAVCAMLGNMQTESNINPGIWESLQSDYEAYFDAHGRYPGYGLVQWTPFTKYSEWAGTGWQNNGDKECERIQYEVDNGLQWFRNPNAPTVDPPITFKEFTTSTLDVETLANYFLWYYEHPATTIQPARSEQALAWYEYLKDIAPEQPGGGNSEKRKSKIFLNSKWATIIMRNMRRTTWL